MSARRSSKACFVRYVRPWLTVHERWNVASSLNIKDSAKPSISICILSQEGRRCTSSGFTVCRIYSRQAYSRNPLRKTFAQFWVLRSPVSYALWKATKSTWCQFIIYICKLSERKDLICCRLSEYAIFYNSAEIFAVPAELHELLLMPVGLSRRFYSGFCIYFWIQQFVKKLNPPL